MPASLVRAVALFVLLALVGIAPVSATSQTVHCFPDHPAVTDCIVGRLNDFWQSNGGLPVFGYPITSQDGAVTPDTHQSFSTQWFERTRLEQHPDLAAPYDVLLGRLGAELLQAQGRDWHNEPNAGNPLGGSCQHFDATNRDVCGPFLAYWQGHGLNDPKLDTYNRSLQLFGLPLTGVKSEKNPNGDTVLTQWFERARFEFHPEQAQTSTVLLGLLGHETLVTAPPAAPPATPQDLQLVSQGFSRNYSEVAYAFVVHNPNTTLEAQNTDYQVALYARNGSVSGSDSSFIEVVHPGETVGISGRIYVASGIETSRIEVQLKSGQFVSPQGRTAEPFHVENPRLQHDPGQGGLYGGTVSGVLVSTWPRTATMIEVYVVAHSAAGQVDGGGFTFVDFVPANGRAAFSVPITCHPCGTLEFYPRFTNLSK